jgi:Skp family chaperone for outer membrane proteins
MKKLLTIIFILSFVSSGMAWPWDKKPVVKTEIKKPVPVKVETGSSLQQAKQVIKELNAELNAAKSENAKLKTNLENANKKVDEAKSNTAIVQKQADALKEWGIQKQQEAFKWLEKYNNAIKRYHRLKWIAAIIAAAGGVLLGLQFMNFVPPPYNLLVPIGGAGLFASLIWIFL